MAIQNPPKYRYSFIEQWDKDTFTLIKQLAKSREYPQMNGSGDDKSQF